MAIEKKIIVQTISYLVIRDIWLAMLIFVHISSYYHFFLQVNPIILSVLGAGALVWICFFAKLMGTVWAARKDAYMVTAFKDEYFSNIKIKAGYNGYMTMLLCCLFFIFGSVLLHELSISVDMPIYLAFELVMLLGVITDDISKIVLSRG